MKIKIEMDNSLTEEEVIIRCGSFTEDIVAIQRAITEATNERRRFMVTKGEAEYYLLLEEILFFETTDSMVSVHTKEKIYQTKLRLYELEELLPASFIRVSKSTILNSSKIRALHKNLTGASEVEFGGTNKKVFVSRNYFKPLKAKLEEKRLK